MPRHGSIKIIFAMLTLAHSTTLMADKVSHEKAVKQYFHVTKMEDAINATIDQMTDMQMRANSNLSAYRPVVLAFFRKYMAWESLEGDFVKLYMKEFTEDEMKEMTRFYDSPLGKKITRRLPEITAQATAIGQTRVQDNLGELRTALEKAQQENQGGSKTGP